MHGTTLAARLSTKFVLITVALLTLSGGIGFFVGKTNLDSLIDLNQKAEAAAAGEIAVLQKQLVTSLTAEETLDIRLAEAVNAGALTQKNQDIEARKAFLRGKSEGALLVISSQLESILSPMPEDDREFFEANSDVYLEVLTDAKEINYFPAVDLESLDEVAADNELDPARKTDFARAIENKSRADKPLVNILAADGIIRFVATIGPLDSPFGIMEMVLDDSVTPLNKEAADLGSAFAADLDERKTELATQFAGRKTALEASIGTATAARSARTEETATVGTRAQTSHGLVVVLSTVISAVVIGFVVVVIITRPLSASIATMNRLSAGDTDADVGGTERSDEIGELARDILTFKEAVIERQTMEAEREADRERRRSLRAREQKAVEQKLGSSLETAVAEVGQKLEEVNAISGELDGSASGTRSRSEEVANATEDANRLAHSVAEATRELTQEIGVIDAQVGQATTISKEAAGLAADARTTVGELDAAAERVGEVVGLINDIAEQTNLLALNATIEAARAGDAGKGFAVVASEVKTLADQTAKATDQITEQIGDIQTVSKEAGEAIGAIAAKVGEVDSSTAAIVDAVARQRETTAKIADMSSESTERMRSVDQLIREVEEMATETGSLSAGLKERGASVSETIDHLGAKMVGDVRGIFAELGKSEAAGATPNSPPA